MQEPLHSGGISHKMSCKLLKQLETNCWKIPPRDTWQEKPEMARDLGAKLRLFPSQSVRNSKFLFCRCWVTVWAHTSAGCRWSCTFTFPLCTGSGILGTALLIWTAETHLDFFFSSPLLHELISSSHIIHSPSLPHPCSFHDKWILSAEAKNTGPASTHTGLLPAATATSRDCMGLLLLRSTVVWDSPEPREYLAAAFTLPGTDVANISPWQDPFLIPPENKAVLSDLKSDADVRRAPKSQSTWVKAPVLNPHCHHGDQ